MVISVSFSSWDHFHDPIGICANNPCRKTRYARMWKSSGSSPYAVGSGVDGVVKSVAIILLRDTQAPSYTSRSYGAAVSALHKTSRRPIWEERSSSLEP